MADGISARAGPRALVPADQRTHRQGDDAWRVVFADARRWQVELCYQACKTDMDLEGPRLWFWENRLKLMLMVSLLYSFLLSLMDPSVGYCC